MSNSCLLQDAPSVETMLIPVRCEFNMFRITTRTRVALPKYIHWSCESCLQSSHGFYSSGLVDSPVVQSSYALRSMECPTVTPSTAHTSCPWKKTCTLRWLKRSTLADHTAEREKFRACIATMKRVFETISWALRCVQSSSKQVIISPFQTRERAVCNWHHDQPVQRHLLIISLGHAKSFVCAKMYAGDNQDNRTDFLWRQLSGD